METTNDFLWKSRERNEQVIPKDPGAPTTIETALRFAKEGRDDKFYNKLYQLQLVMSGDTQTIDDLSASGWAGYTEHPDLGAYPDIDPDLGPEGVQNDVLIDSRINIQSIVYQDPRFVIPARNPIIKDYIQAYLKDLWDDDDLSQKCYEVGMDCECMGVGFMEWGIGHDGSVSGSPFSPLDAIWDRKNRNPGSWRYFWIRRWLDLEDAYEKYGHAVPYSILKELCTVMRWQPRSGKSTSNSGDRGEMHGILEWTYWDRNSYGVFLGGISGTRKIVFGLDEQYRHQPLAMDAQALGPNPFNTIPVSRWIDSMTPGVRRPVSKVETTIRTSSLISKLEDGFRVTIDEGGPVNTLNFQHLDKDDAKELQGAKSLKNLGRLIGVTHEDAQKAFHRFPADEIPQSWIQLWQISKEKMKGSTGVMDSQKGQSLGGEARSAFEVRMMEQQGGVQNRHIRKQYRRFLAESVKIIMKIGAKFESKRRLLVIPKGVIDTAMFPVNPFLNIEFPIGVQEDSLSIASEEERQQRRMIEFTSVDVPAIELGTADPLKVIEELYRDLGVNPQSRMYSAEQLAMRQAAEQQMALAAMSANGRSDEPSSGGNADRSNAAE